MRNDQFILSVLQRHRVPFIVIGGHAVIFHGHARATEDVDIIWQRSPESEQSLLSALSELKARFIGNDIDPATRIERDYPVTLPFIQSNHLMMLVTQHGFLDLFDYVPGFPDQNTDELLESSIESDGLRFASLQHLRRMKKASGRPKDQLDLENLPDTP